MLDAMGARLWLECDERMLALLRDAAYARSVGCEMEARAHIQAALKVERIFMHARFMCLDLAA